MAKAKVIQIQVSGDRLYSLRDDGTIWVHYNTPKPEGDMSEYWEEIPKITSKDDMTDALMH